MPRQHDEAEEGSRSNGGVCCNGVEHYNLTVPSTTTMPRPTGLTRTTTMPSPTGPEAAKTVPSSMVPASTGYEFLCGSRIVKDRCAGSCCKGSPSDLPGSEPRLHGPTWNCRPMDAHRATSTSLGNFEKTWSFSKTELYSGSIGSVFIHCEVTSRPMVEDRSEVVEISDKGSVLDRAGAPSQPLGASSGATPGAMPTTPQATIPCLLAVVPSSTTRNGSSRHDVCSQQQQAAGQAQMDAAMRQQQWATQLQNQHAPGRFPILLRRPRGGQELATPPS